MTLSQRPVVSYPVRVRIMKLRHAASHELVRLRRLAAKYEAVATSDGSMTLRIVR